MKHALILIVCLVAVGVAAHTAISDHRTYISQLTAQAEQKAKTVAQQELAAHAQAAAEQAELNKLEASCQNGLTAYNLLTPSQRLHATKPDCSE